MTNWDEYKEHVRATDAVAAKIIDETEMLSPIIAEMISRDDNHSELYALYV